MEKHQLERARSTAVIPRTPSSITRVPSSTPTLGLRRFSSCPSLNISHDLYLADRHRPRRFHYRKGDEWTLYDEYWWDRRYYTSPLYWQTYRYAGRRYNYNDPPFSLNYYYPGIYESKYHWSILDYLDPNYWRRYGDPYYDRPTWFPYKSFIYDSMDVARGLSMYKQKLINFDTLDKNWLAPVSFNRRYSHLREHYVPTGYYGPRRYFYAWGSYY